jgi:uncharacterized membrane protein YfcA
MTELIILCLASFATSLLTFFSGFGLGTILMPVFAIFFPVELAIALTGVVHFLNNIFKLSLVGLKADKQAVIRFGIPAFIAAFAGAWLLLRMIDMQPLYEYSIGDREFMITPLKLVIAVLLIFFSIMEVVPFRKSVELGKGKLVIGGILSGFFGGLSGHQGALRSAFLIKSNLAKEAFIATGIVIACMVDLSRLGVYITRFSDTGLGDNVVLVIAATVSAFAGAYLGNRLLKKVTLKTVQVIVTAMIFILSIALGLGLV